ncbi:lysozyme inhibitor LprI family protein [Psychrobacter urativorans]|uniref:Lysozyme inhibitor LprI N-terminal domain-containing protein n=1 Tax=Psychrobacter urativorans TaxID=45610 RepID=A0A0M3V923_9GAMM|nr:hypothetical protein [Psychrobacter urativorans]ALF59887.1 hypothetical protein AOC03_07405 [Psychrobacter urativorans]
MKKLTLTISSILGISLLSTYANSASFDCNKASTWVEKAICKSPELFKLDDAMARKYRKNLANVPDYEVSKDYKNNVIADQQLWLNFQRNTCKDTKCLIREYKEYIEDKTYDDWNDDLSSSDMPDKNAFGEFSKKHQISIYNPETNRQENAGMAKNSATINRVNNKPYLSLIEGDLIFDNAHTCGIEDSVATWSQNHWVIHDNSQDKDAELRLYPAPYKGKTQLLLKDINYQFSSGRCGVRGYFDGILLEREN